MRDLDPVAAMIARAMSRTVSSAGLPMLTGSFRSDSASRTTPSTRSLMKQKLRVWSPLP